jgi:serine/threonine protein kinase
MSSINWFTTQNLGIFRKDLAPIAASLEKVDPSNRSSVGRFVLLNLSEDPKFPDSGSFKKIFYCVTLGLVSGSFTVHVAAQSRATCETFIKEKRVMERLSGVAGVLKPLLLDRIGDYEYMITELYNRGTMLDYMTDYSDSLDALKNKQLAYRLLCSVMGCHACGVILRDLKLENVLVRELDDGNLDVVLIDFGFGFLIGEDDETNSMESMGSPHYICPDDWVELKAKKKVLPVNFSRDSWALGIVLYAMASKSMPNDHPQDGDYHLIPKGTVPLSFFESEINDLIYSKRSESPSLESIKIRMEAILFRSFDVETAPCCLKIY